MKKIISENFDDKSSEKKKEAPLHFSSYYFLEQDYSKNHTFHNFSSSLIAEEEYQHFGKKKNTLIDITTLPLKNEYIKKINSLYSGINTIFIISCLYIIDSIINIKYLDSDGFNISILIVSIISISIIALLLIAIKLKLLIDIYGYVIFYFFSIIESSILLTLYTLKTINFILVFRLLNASDSCRNKYACPGYFMYLLILVFSIIIFASILWSGKFAFFLFYDAFNILVLKRKTFFQKQIEIDENNEKYGKGGTIEFVDEKDSFNSSKNNLTSKDEFKLD